MRMISLINTAFVGRSSLFTPFAILHRLPHNLVHDCITHEGIKAYYAFEDIQNSRGLSRLAALPVEC
jgi:hypothetical protein